MIQTVNDDVQIIGESVMDIGNSRQWQERMCALLAENGSSTVRLDMSAVEKIDTACLQLLLAFVLAAAAKDLKIEWGSPSARFLAAAHSLNLSGILRLPYEFNGTR